MIDIDGNDAHVWDSINVINPRVVCVEYNAYFGPTTEWTIVYDPDFQWIDDGGNINYGASLKLLENLGKRKPLLPSFHPGLNRLMRHGRRFLEDDVIVALPEIASSEH